MQTYDAPLRDMRFVLHELHGLEALTSLPPFADLNAETVDVVLEEAAWPVWLGEAEGDAAALMRPAGEDVLRFWPVGPAVNKVANNTADLLAPLVETASP